MDPELQVQMKDLASYIQGNEGYQVLPLDQSVAEVGNRELAEAMNPVPDQAVRRLTPEATEGTDVGEPSSGVTSDAGSTAGLGAQNAGVTSHPSVAFDAERQSLQRQLADVQRREEAANAAAIRMANQAALREEENFRLQLAQEPDPAIRAQKYVAFKEKQADARVNAIQAQLDGIKFQTNQDKEEFAKRQIAVVTAQQYGLAPEDLMYLQMAQTPEEMESVAVDLARRAGKTRQTTTQQTRQQRIESGVDVAGGEQAGFVPPKAPKERSGDLIGLIRSRQPQLVNAFIER